MGPRASFGGRKLVNVYSVNIFILCKHICINPNGLLNEFLMMVMVVVVLVIVTVKVT